MNPSKVNRDRLNALTDLPNIGPAMAKDLQLLGISKPEQLLGRSPYQMYQQLCQLTGCRQDLCVLDVFLSITDFIEEAEPKAWWHYTAQRKAFLQDKAHLQDRTALQGMNDA
ncbi:helix-hairpin-helix domain-containing protein [Shewanella sp. AS1]|uniref:helix-hairpin-helix domain-containing protein n=1 Tax=Shewanella sp. AS1 TaxID=2907626 RepID=UPI001F37BC2D|nr:helix-hairpin-helix domain-containing protein [Shewanella sp. AS1]MCE9679413.1 helix-hairpin-helix domain-containing protein [Shewanella sp. AS1]